MELKWRNFEKYIRIFHIAVLFDKTKCYFRGLYFEIFKSNV